MVVAAGGLPVRPVVHGRIARGFLAGVLGTAALTLSDRVERLVLGQRPIYSHTRIGRLLARQWLIHPARGSRLGAALRWTYGPLWGAAYGALRPWLPRRRLAAAPMLSAAIYLVEITVFPLVGATPPVERWPPVQRGTLLVHTSAYALATALAY